MEDTPEAAEELYTSIAAGDQLVSAPPALLDYLGHAGGAHEVLVITPAREFAPMHTAAKTAAAISSWPFEVVDSRTAGAAEYLVVEATLRVIEQGAGAAEAAELARDLALRTELVAALPDAGPGTGVGTVEPSRSRRQPGPAPMRSLVRIRNGAAITDPGDEESDIDDPISRLRSEWLEDGGWNADMTVVFHSGAPLLASELATRLGCDARIGRLSPSLGQLTGIGCIGIAWTRRGESPT